MKLKLGSRKNGLGGIPVWKRPSKIAGLDIATKHADIERSLDFMTQNFCEPIQLRDMVKVSGMSRRGFCKAFNRKVGANPGAVLRHIRIEYAKRLLVECDLSLRQIAQQCGFRSENTFCVAFQRAVGMPPKKFQRQYWLAICRDLSQGRTNPAGLNRSSMPIISTRMWFEARPLRR
jgi:AraC-like DNA-binding protein